MFHCIQKVVYYRSLTLLNKIYCRIINSAVRYNGIKRFSDNLFVWNVLTEPYFKIFFTKHDNCKMFIHKNAG